jgi:hypothetical protein
MVARAYLPAGDERQACDQCCGHGGRGARVEVVALADGGDHIPALRHGLGEAQLTVMHTRTHRQGEAKEQNRSFTVEF